MIDRTDAMLARHRALSPCDYCGSEERGTRRSESALRSAADECDVCLRLLLSFAAVLHRRYFEAHRAGLQGHPWDCEHDLEREVYDEGVRVRELVPRYNAVERERDAALEQCRKGGEAVSSAVQVLDGVLCLMAEGPDAAPGRWQGPAMEDVQRALGILKGTVAP